MSAPRLGRAFFARDAKVVARALIGCHLVDTRGGTRRVARIVETEAYRGPTDAACHARFGRTKRTQALFGTPGTAYVFLVYGMHLCFNVVCAEAGAGHAVLLRGVEPLEGFAGRPPRGDGPGRLTRALAIDRSVDGVDLVDGALHFTAAAGSPHIACSPRVGVGYAGGHATRLLRFYDRQSPSVSRPPASAIGLGKELPRLRVTRGK